MSKREFEYCVWDAKDHALGPPIGPGDVVVLKYRKRRVIFIAPDLVHVFDGVGWERIENHHNGARCFETDEPMPAINAILRRLGGERFRRRNLPSLDECAAMIAKANSLTLQIQEEQKRDREAKRRAFMGR